MAIDGKEADRIMLRKSVWLQAAEMIDPVVDKHGLEQYALGPAPVFTTPPNKMTPVDQHLGHIQQVADWLMEVE